MSSQVKRYAQVGLGGRSAMYTRAITESHAQYCQLVALCDNNDARMQLVNRRLAEKKLPAVPTFAADQFDAMVRQARPDVVVVTSKDSTHCQYICRAMELGCDVVTEKPMTIDDASARKILKTAAATGRKLQVTFNYRYAPPRSQLREIIASGAIGQVLSVDFAWMLDTRHGADYFRRWHRQRENSGSLLVHKSTHHFDLVNWWLDDVPQDVFAFGSRRYYTPQMADSLGLQGRGERCHGCPAASRCRFFLDMAANKHMKELYLDCEAADGYFRDRCVFSDQIDIWDNMAVSVRYRGGALLSYILHSYSPYEGYRIAFNGTKGRLEHNACENTYISGDGTVPGELTKGKTSITLAPEFSQPQDIPVRTAAGGHGGGDPILLDDVFHPNPPADPLKRKASQRDGAYSIMIGIAAAQSIDRRQAVAVSDLLGDAPIGN